MRLGPALGFACVVVVGCLAGCASPAPIPPPQSSVAPLLSGLSAQVASLAAEATPAVVELTCDHQLLHPAGDYLAGLGRRVAGLLQPLPAYWEYPLRVLAVPFYLVTGPFDLRTTRGTGFFVSEELLLTNAHVVHNVASVTARLADGRRAALTVERSDPDLDLALLRVSELEGNPPTPLRLRKERVLVGEVVFALGFPRKAYLSRKRELADAGATLTGGIVSVVDLDLGGACRYLETDAALTYGNSGGPLFDLEGGVVGVATMVATGDARASYGIPAEVVRDFLEAVLALPNGR